MKEKKLTIMLIALLCAVVQGALAQNNPILWDFEDEAQLDGWTLVDNDGDEFNWKYYSNTGRENGRMTTQSGDGIMMSASYDNEEMGPLSPDNWLISPEVTLGGTLSLWACGQDDTYCHEIFAVYVSVDGMTNGVGSELVGGGHFIQVGTDITTTGDMIMYAFNLKQFEGTTGRFAIRHYKTTDEFILNIDDIELDTDKEYIPDPTTPTNLTVALAATTANVTWDGAEGDKWNLRYKVINPNETVNLLWDLTEDNYESLTEDWTVEDRDGDGNNWGFAYSYYDPNGTGDPDEKVGFCSDSYTQNDGPLSPNNWLISPELPLGGTFTFYAQNDSYPADVLGVYVITDEGTFQIGVDFTPPKDEWEKYSFDTKAYKGQVGKIAIVHHNCTDGWHVYVCYISYIKEGDYPATWTEVNGLATTSCTLTDLDPETKYEVQVQAYNQKGESTWTGSIFTTTKLTDVTEIGSGTEADPYIITTIAQMQTLATKMNNTTNHEHFVGVHFALGNDLDFSGETFTTIATGAGVKYYFSGTFDGRGHTISGINFDSGTSGRRGIFGLVRNGGTVKNLTLKSSTIKGGDATGGIVGRLMAGCLVENCHVESDVTVTGINYAGGVVGYNLGGTIRACSSAANVSGSYYIGGITGACDPGSTVENCFYYGGSITGTNVGAIVGIETHPINTLPNYNYLGNLYYTTANIKGVDGSDKDGAERGYKIISGTDDLTFKYNNNDGSIIRYDDYCITKIGDGLYYKGVYYGKANGSVNIVASIPSGTITKLETDNGTLTGSFNAYKLTFADADATITAIVADEPIDVTLYDNDTDATEENASIISANDEQYANVTLSGRTLYKDGCWNTLCLPFDFVIEGSSLEDATIMVLDGEGSSFDNETGTLTLNFTDYTETVFTAGTACIVKWASGSDIENPVFNGAVIKNVQPAATSSSDNAVTFVGLYSPKAFTAEGDKTILYLGADDKLHYPNGEMTIYAFRSYFQLNNGLVCGEPDQSGGVNAFVLNFGHGNETAISLITYPSSLTFDAWYTIDGRKLIGKPTTKGIYINNGRKVVIK